MSNYRGKKQDPYQKVTDKIVEALEKGVAPWSCPWNRQFGQQRNGKTNHVYQGMNVLMTMLGGYGDPRWYTFNQVKQIGGYVRKGSKGTTIVKWLFIDNKAAIAEAKKNGKDPSKCRKIPLLKTFCVFNHEQVEWAEGCEPEAPKMAEVKPGQEYADSQKLLAEIVAERGLKMSHTLNAVACYKPHSDEVEMPKAGLFKSESDYWSTMWHEVAHWTGHESRTNRQLKNRFGSEQYAAEELVAELSSAFMCHDFNVHGKLQHEEYLGHWIKVLKDDKYAIFTAARLAREAVAFAKGEKKSKEGADSEPGNRDAAQSAKAA
jgi:antirestriction protein ArdC